MRALFATLATIVGLTLLACAGTQDATPTAGQSPVPIKPPTWAQYQKYLATQSPLAFAVSTDGNYCGYTWCEDSNCPQYLLARSEALNLCGRAGGTQCRIFDIWSKIKLPYAIDSSAAQPQSGRAPGCLSQSYSTPDFFK